MDNTATTWYTMKMDLSCRHISGLLNNFSPKLLNVPVFVCFVPAVAICIFPEPSLTTTKNKKQSCINMTEPKNSQAFDGELISIFSAMSKATPMPMQVYKIRYRLFSVSCFCFIVASLSESETGNINFAFLYFSNNIVSKQYAPKLSPSNSQTPRVFT